MPTQQPVRGIVPGQFATFDATPVDASGNTITETLPGIPVWVSSDPVNAPISATTENGLSTGITVAQTAPIGTSFTLSVSFTNSDGSAASGTTPVPFIAQSVLVASFVITERPQGS